MIAALWVGVGFFGPLVLLVLAFCGPELRAAGQWLRRRGRAA